MKSFKSIIFSIAALLLLTAPNIHGAAKKTISFMNFVEAIKAIPETDGLDDITLENIAVGGQNCENCEKTVNFDVFFQVRPEDFKTSEKFLNLTKSLANVLVSKWPSNPEKIGSFGYHVVFQLTPEEFKYIKAYAPFIIAVCCDTGELASSSSIKLKNNSSDGAAEINIKLQEGIVMTQLEDSIHIIFNYSY